MSPDELRQVIDNCKRTSHRLIGHPHRWNPEKIELITLRGFYMSSAGAWEYIAEQLGNGHCYEEMILDNPAGCRGLTMSINYDQSRAPIYVKLQLGSNKIIGRSFHYSVY